MGFCVSAVRMNPRQKKDLVEEFMMQKAMMRCYVVVLVTIIEGELLASWHWLRRSDKVSL